MLMEGDDPKTLRRAVGHIPGTPLPGHPGNAALSGHRDTFFRPLRNIREGDMIVVTTLEGEFRYRVVSTRIVSSERHRCVERQPRRNPDAGYLLSVLFCRCGARQICCSRRKACCNTIFRNTTGPGGLNL